MAEVTLKSGEHAVVAFAGDLHVASAWGPAADGTGEWFVAFADGTSRRVASRDAAVAALPTEWPEASRG